MEWIRISPHKLKIMLSAEDARRYALDCQQAELSDTLTRAAFREILTDMQSETGFDAGDDKIYIQMYPSKAGGCELFVTKMGLSFTDSAAGHSSKQPPSSSAISPQTVSKKALAFRFAKLDPLLSLCRTLAPDYQGESAVFRGEDRTWWLILIPFGNDSTARRCERLCREYGQTADAAKTLLLLREHGHPICETDTIAKLGAL